jgi:hypothetical protein
MVERQTNKIQNKQNMEAELKREGFNQRDVGRSIGSWICLVAALVLVLLGVIYLCWRNPASVSEEIKENISKSTAKEKLYSEELLKYTECLFCFSSDSKLNETTRQNPCNLFLPDNHDYSGDEISNLVSNYSARFDMDKEQLTSLKQEVKMSFAYLGLTTTMFVNLNSRNSDSVNSYLNNAINKFGYILHFYFKSIMDVNYEHITMRIEILKLECAPEIIFEAEKGSISCVTRLGLEIVKLNRCIKMYGEFFKYVQSEIAGPESELSQQFSLVYEHRFE